MFPRGERLEVMVPTYIGNPCHDSYDVCGICTDMVPYHLLRLFSQNTGPIALELVSH